MPRHPELQNVTHTGALLVVGRDPQRPVGHRSDDTECGHDDEH